MTEYCKRPDGTLDCPTYDQCHHRGICLATPRTLQPEQVVDCIKQYRSLYTRAKAVGIKIAELRNTCEVDAPVDSVLRLEMYPAEIDMVFEERACRRGCCGTQQQDLSFPTSYLWTENYVEIETLRIAEAKIENSRLQKEKAEQDKKDVEALKVKRELAALARLKEKYPNG